MGTEKNQIKIEDRLTALQNRLYDISRRNPLVNINKEKLWFHTEPDVGIENAKKIFDKQNHFLKEYGLDTTLSIDLFIQWKDPLKQYFYCSPLLYQPVRIKKNQKIELQYHLELSQPDIWLVNPVIVQLFKQKFDHQFDDYYTSVDDVIAELEQEFNSEKHQITVLDNFSDREEWQIIKRSAIGTFNYHKSLLARDFGSIIESPNSTVKALLGFEQNALKPPITDHLDWFPLDTSQKKVVGLAASNNLVIQGPPGTGKSHTIATLLQHYLSLEKRVLFVSEKKSALDVVYQRLHNFENYTAYFDVEKQSKLSFYKSLKKAYENQQSKTDFKVNPVNNAALSKNQLYPKGLRHKELNKSTSISDLEEKLIKSTAPKKTPSLNCAIPDYELWRTYLDQLIRIEQLANKEWQINTLGESSFLALNKGLFKERDVIAKIDRKIDELLSNIDLIHHIQSNYQLDLSWDEFSKICLSASILNMVNHSQLDLLFEDTKAYKSFNNWSKKYQLTKHQLDEVKQRNLSWKKRPSIQAIESHQFLMNSKGLLARLKLSRSHKRLFKHYSQTVPVKHGNELLNRLLKEFELSEKLKEISIKLKHNLNILNPDTDIDFILSIRKKTDSVAHNFYQVLLEHDEQEELIGLLADQHKTIANINRIKSYLFTGELPQKINQLTLYLNGLKSELSYIQLFVSEVKSILELPLSILNFIKHNKFTVDELTRSVTKNELDHRLKYQDFLKHLTGNELLNHLESFNNLKTKTYSELVVSIQERQAAKWQSFERIAATPNSKLKEKEKETKAHFKKAKRLMVHEMNKSRQLLPVKELFESCANELTTLLPIWMLNPLAISERLPLEPDLFDVVIFDESSQIPLEDALPAVYRSKQVVVVGDSQQMPPNLFFSSSQQNTVTLLDEAEKVLPNEPLLWHYRSEHPDLISFSNRNFYDNELKLFPAINYYQAVEHHYIANGCFSNSENELEASAIALRFKELLEENISSIGIIAFSKAQENCIRKKVSALNLTIPDSVSILNLESVQGIEKAHVLISIGYAKNEEGKLNLNFGPINQEQGANRLNVLFSRATKKMEVYTSINASDIGLSDNRGLSLLSQFLNFSSIKQNGSIDYHDSLTDKISRFLSEKNYKLVYHSEYSGYIINSFIDYKTRKVVLINPGMYSEGDTDVGGIVDLLKKRFNDVKIILNNDWILDSKKVLEQLETFLS